MDLQKGKNIITVYPVKYAYDLVVVCYVVVIVSNLMNSGENGIGYPTKFVLNWKHTKFWSSVRSISVIKAICISLKSNALVLPCFVQNFKMIWHAINKSRGNDILWDLCLQWSPLTRLSLASRILQMITAALPNKASVPNTQILMRNI